MASFPTTVAPPSGLSYAAPLMSFQQFSNWAADDPYQQQFNQQQVQLNDARIQQMRQQVELSKAFAGGLPTDGSGNVDYRKAAAILASKGDIGGAVSLLQSQPPAPSPLLGGGQSGGGGAPVAAPAAGPAPTSIPAKPLPPPAQNSPQGDAGSGTIASMVTDTLKSEDAATGQTIARVAQVMGVDPNANLTPGQIRRAQGLIQRYAPQGAQVASAGSDQPAPPQSRIAGGFAALPPSANAETAAPPAAAAPQPQAAQRAPGGQGAPIGAGGQPIVPQVPLPQGFSDPQAAIMALRREAARYGAMPNGKAQAQELHDYANRIEESIKPMSVGPQSSLIDPRTGKVLYEGPAAAALRATEQGNASPTLDADAERYRQTGQLPPNMGRGMQGSAEARAIRQRATEQEIAAGGDPAKWPANWQKFKTQQTAIQRFTSGKQGDTVRSFNVLVDHLDTLSEAAAALNNGDSRLLNRFRQNWAAATGGTAPTNFDGVKALVGDEIVKAVVGGAGALADREEVKKDLDRASSPKQLAELVEKYRKLALGQLHGLQKQYETSTGQKNFGEMLLPGTLKALGGLTEGKGDAKPDADGWITQPNGVRIREVK